MEMQPTAGPRCALHPLEAALATCGRCGNFMCHGCMLPGSPLCPTCRARVGERPWPLTRTSWSFDAVWKLAFEAFKLNWVNLTVAVLITIGVSMAVGAVGSVLQLTLQALKAPIAITTAVTVGMQVVSSATQGVLGMGLAKMVLEMFAGRPVEIPLVFSGFAQLGRWAVTVLLAALYALPALAAVGLAVAVGVSAHGSPGLGTGVVVAILVVALVAYGFWVGVPLSFLSMALMGDTRASPTQVIRSCFTLVEGQRFSVFGVLFMQGLVVMAGLVACCVGVLPATALVTCIQGALYLSLRNEPAL